MNKWTRKFLIVIIAVKEETQEITQRVSGRGRLWMDTLGRPPWDPNRVCRSQPRRGQGRVEQGEERVNARIPRRKGTGHIWEAGRSPITQCLVGCSKESRSVNWEVSLGSTHTQASEESIRRDHKLRREKFTSMFFLNSNWNVKFPSITNVGNKSQWY